MSALIVAVQDPTAAKAGRGESVELPSEVFDVELNTALIHQVVVGQLAAARQGTHATKTRGEVRGGGTKPYRQKGTGRARQGSIRAPQFTGGGTVHGPQPRSYDQRTPKKMKAAALRCALSDRARNGQVFVVSSLVAGDTPSTKAAAETLAKVSAARRILVVANRSDELTWKSLRNVPAVHLLDPGQLNTYDVLVADDVVFTRSALESFLGAPLTASPVRTTKAKAAAKPAAEPAAADAAAAAESSAAAADPESSAAAESEADSSATTEEG